MVKGLELLVFDVFPEHMIFEKNIPDRNGENRNQHPVFHVQAFVFAVLDAENAEQRVLVEYGEDRGDAEALDQLPLGREERALPLHEVRSREFERFLAAGKFLYDRAVPGYDDVFFIGRLRVDVEVEITVSMIDKKDMDFIVI